jgi:hypothetical protein
MWNMNEVYAANERIEDIRRTADKHNAIARMQAASQGKQPDKQANDKQQKQKLWERMRNALR